MSNFSNLVNIKSNIERTLYEYIKSEFNDNSFGVDFELGFWAQYHNPEQTKRIEVEGSEYLKKDKRFVPMAIEIFDGDILAIEGIFNAEYTLPISFEIFWDDKEFADKAINAIEEVKNRQRGQIRRLSVEIDEETEEDFTMVVTANNLTPVGDIQVRMGEEYIFAEMNIYFDISKDVLYGNQVRVYLSYLGSEEVNYEWVTLEEETVFIDFDTTTDIDPPEAPNLIWRKLISEELSFTYNSETFEVDAVVTDESNNIEILKSTFQTSGSWLESQDDGKRYLLLAKNGYCIAEEIFEPGEFRELVPVIDGSTNYDEEVVLGSLSELEEAISELDISGKAEGYRYGFTVDGVLFAIYKVEITVDKHQIGFGATIKSHDRLVTSYSSETNQASLEIELDTNYPFDSGEEEGEILAFLYGGASEASVLFGHVEKENVYEFYISQEVDEEEESEEYRIYPLSPSMGRDNTPETIQNFNRTQAYSIVQESEYDISFALIMKDDELHWKILEDIVNKNFLQERYKLRLEFNRFDQTTKQLVPKFEFVDTVMILNGMINFGIGEEISGAVVFKKYIKEDE